MRRSLPLLVAAAAALSVTAPMSASARGVAPPANNDIANATVVEVPDALTGSTVGATRAVSDPTDLPGQATVWYSFTAESSKPVEAVTEVDNGGQMAALTVFEGTPADLTTVVVGRPSDPATDYTHEYARFQPKAGTTYYLGVGGHQSGSTFSLTLEQAKKPSATTIRGLSFAGAGQGQLYTPPGEHPRVKVVVATGFAGARKPGRGPVRLTTSKGDSYKAQLKDGRATFVLPKIRRSYGLEVTYPGSARIDASSATAYMNASAGPS